MESIRLEIPPNEEIDRVRESRPTDAELALAIAHAVPWNNPVAYTLKLEIEYLQMLVKLLQLSERNMARLPALLLGVDAKKTCEALQAWDRVCKMVSDEEREGAKSIWIAALKEALEGPGL